MIKVKNIPFLKNFSNETKKIIINLSSLMFSQLLRYSINIFISIWIVRYLGTVLFGTFSYVVALTGIFGIFSSLGLQSIVVRELVARPENSRVLLGTSLFLSFTAGLMSFVVMLLTVFFLNRGEETLFYLTLISGFTFLFDTFKIISYHYEALVESNKVSKINNFSVILTSLLKILVLYFNLGVFLLSSLFILESAISGLVLFYIFSKNVYSPKRFIVNTKLAKSLLKDALPLIMSGFMIGIYMKMDQIMIKNLLGDKEAGIFSVAVRLTELFYFIPVIILSSFFPGIVSSKNDPVLFRKKLNNLYSILIIFSYLVIIFTTIFSHHIIKTLYGSEFLLARDPLLISIWALLFVCLGVARNAFIISHNLNKYYMYTTIIGALINILCNIFFIPRYGIIGASVSTIISYFVSAYLSSLFFKPLNEDFYFASKLLIFPRINFKVL